MNIIKCLIIIGIIQKYIPDDYNDIDITKLRWNLYNDYLKKNKSI